MCTIYKCSNCTQIIHKLSNLLSIVDFENMTNKSTEFNRTLIDLQNRASAVIKSLSTPPNDSPLPDISAMYNSHQRSNFYILQTHKNLNTTKDTLSS